MDFLNDFVMPLATSRWVYVLAFASIVLDAFLPMFPSETAVVGLAALAAAAGAPDVFILAVVAAAAAIVGDNIAFALGRWAGRGRLSRMKQPTIVGAMIWARGELERRPASVLLTSRYIPFGRTAVTMTAGASGFPWMRFAPLSVLAGGAWAIYMVLVGVLTGTWMQDNPVLGVCTAILVAVMLGSCIDRIVNAMRSGRRTKGV